MENLKAAEPGLKFWSDQSLEPSSFQTDIIAVQGLTPNDFQTWVKKVPSEEDAPSQTSVPFSTKQKAQRKDKEVMWLRDLLVPEFKNARIATYSYKSDWRDPNIYTTLDQCGRQLLEIVHQHRQSEHERSRPLIFIGHSLGGIVIQQALVTAVHGSDFVDLRRSVAGIIFLRTPFQGSNAATYGMWMARTLRLYNGEGRRYTLLEDLKTNSPVLHALSMDFSNSYGDYDSICFYENREAEYGPINTRFVSTRSATLVGKRMMYMDTDHSGLNKFGGKDDANFQLLLPEIRRMVVNGPSIVADRYHQIDRSLDRAPRPRSTVPFSRDPGFVGREDIIRETEQIYSAVGQHHGRVAFFGLAGVGKTQAAIEYAHRVQKSRSTTSVFWIHASNVERLKQGYQRIATAMEIPGRDGPKNICEVVYQWLCDPRNGRWLMVLDNADDDGIFFNANGSNEQGPLVNFLPQAAHGSILITSRNAFAAQNLVGGGGIVLEIKPMNEDESLALLRTKIPASECGEDEKGLVRALEYIPLAITQAASYIAHRRFTVARYLQLFHESEKNQLYLLLHDNAKDLRRDASLRYAILTTWQISFEQIHNDCPAASGLLALMSMFHRQGIPESLVCADVDELEYEDAVASLVSYSLVRVQSETQTFDMHRLVQLSVRKWLDIRGESPQWQKKSREIMAQIIPNGDYKNWAECQRLLPHAKEVIKTRSTQHQDQLHEATISFNCGSYFMFRGAYKDAELMHRQALELREQALGHDDPETLTSANDLGMVMTRQGKFTEAEMIHQQVLELREKVLGCDNSETLVSLSDLGDVIFLRGEFKRAEEIHRRVLEARERVLGPEHADTLTSVNNVGLVLSRQAMFEEGEVMHRRALEARERTLGFEHPDTITSLNGLGLVITKRGRCQEAEKMYRQALEVRGRILGCDHPNTLTTLSNLGDLLFRRTRYEEAKVIHEQVLEAREKILGEDHPDTLTTVNNIGLVLSRQGMVQDGKAMHRRALTAREKLLGYEHPGTLVSVNGLGSALERQGNYAEAEALYKIALTGRKKLLGHDHPETLISVRKLGNLLGERGRYEESEVMYQWSLEAQERTLGQDDPATRASFGNLAQILSLQGKHEEAEALRQRFKSLEMRKG